MICDFGLFKYNEWTISAPLIFCMQPKYREGFGTYTSLYLHVSPGHESSLADYNHQSVGVGWRLCCCVCLGGMGESGEFKCTEVVVKEGAA